MKKPSVLNLLILVSACAFAPSQAAGANEQADIVRDFLAAFNAHDVEAMTAFVTEDVQWLSINGSAVSVDAEGRTALADAMSGYFSSCPSCRSEIKDLTVTVDRVSAVEVASWEGSDGPRSQQSISVYEFSGKLIQRVYYFPSEAVATTQNRERGDP